MSVVTFWNSGKEETGKTLAIAAISTYMAIEHNYRILVISTSRDDKVLENCFWKPKKTKKTARRNTAANCRHARVIQSVLYKIRKRHA